MQPLNTIAERLKKYREENGLTYAELAEMIGVSKSVAYDIVNGERRFIDLHVVDKILKLVGA